MGATPVADIPDSGQLSNGSANTFSTSQAVDVDFTSFEVPGLASDQDASPTGMKDEVVLLSWLIVLLRTGDDCQVCFDWAYNSGLEREPKIKCLSMDRVMTGLQDQVGRLAAAISDDIDTVKDSEKTTSSPFVSLFLSTSSLSQTSQDAKDAAQGVLHLELRFGDGCLEVRPVWHAENMLQFTVQQHVDVLVETIGMCISRPDAYVEDCLRPTARDLDDIWGWNHELPPTHDFCMHELISERAQASPDKVAISSWDGSLAYAQIDQYSTFVACSLKQAGVKLHDVVPACFEKSRWTIVAVLGVMKAGATFALMDPTLPVARLQNMAIQVGAKTMLTSRTQHGLSTEILPGGTHIVVEEDMFASFSTLEVLPKLPAVPSSALMYIIFTSGSTGTPKGVTISHRTYSSSAIPRAKAVGYSESSRVLDFASYAFDVSIDSMLLTVGNGGCLCIPSDEDRLNDINGVMRKMRVNYAGITPSVARILEPDVIASLHGLGLGGEAASARDVTLWGREARIIIGYGPCECTIGCTVNSSAATGRDYISIGTGNGAAIWIVDPSDHEALVPVGAVGELLVEGPIVGQGYLNDPEKTALAFIEDPSWLVAGHKGYSGRRGRLYKTGDLGKYDPDGSGGIVFAGRKDTQVKLRGQRVELGEIESQLRARLPSDTNVIAEVIVPEGAGGQPTLVAFVAPQATKGYADDELCSVQLPSEFGGLLSKADAELAKVVPRYMVPTAYIPVNHIPVLISGKTDRKRLRQFGQAVNLRQLTQGATTTTQELSDIEKCLRQAWSQVLNLDADGIGPGDNLFALGGDSLAAMRLVSVCRGQGLDLSVTSAFANPTLSAMADVVRTIASQVRIELPPFAMISQDVESARLEASLACGVDQAAIEDIYPSTPTQQSLFTFALKSTKAYIAQRVARIPLHVDLAAWKKAWEEVVAANAILRSRLAQLQEPGLQQVVLNETISWRDSNDLAQYLENDRNEKMELGQNLARYAIIMLPDGQRYMVWTIHHVLYDGWSEPLVLEQVRNALQHQVSHIPAEMRDFVSWVRSTDDVAMQKFWQEELKGAVGPQFPPLPSRDYLPTPSAMIEREIPLETMAGSPFTVATLIRGAWALVASQYSGNDDVVFGETLTGRDISLPGVESVVGPLIATVPVRIRIQRTDTVETYLQAVQQGVLARTSYQHMGFQNIRKVSQDAQIACETGTGLVIQPESDYVGDDLGFDHGDVVREALHFNAYPVMLACGKRKSGLRVCASFDKSLVEVAQMRRILAQLEMASVSQASSDINHQTLDREPKLVVFVEQPPSEEDSVQLIAGNHDVALDGKALRICASIPTSLAKALKRLDKSIRESFTSYMAPFAYVVVERIPTDHKTLSQLASSVPRHILTELREGVKEAWAQTAPESVLTPAEDVLRSSWAKVLGMTAEQIDVDDNFFRLGGDSVLAMKLVSSLRAQGHRLSVADIFLYMRLCDAAKVMNLNQASATNAKLYKPFSALSQVDVDAFLSRTVHPKLADPRWSIQDVYPVTDSQALDVRATIQAPRTSVQYTMLYFDSWINQDRLIRACNDLVNTHDVLRTVFIENESNTLQVVLKELNTPLTTQQAEGDLERYAIELCKVDIESHFALGSPFLKMVHVQSNAGQSCLVIRLSHAQYDGTSLPRLLHDLSTLYTGAAIANFEPYSAYIAHIHSESAAQIKALNYWRNLLAGSSLSVLVGSPAQATEKALFRAKPVQVSQRLEEITLATLLTAAWALVLVRRLRKPDVTFGAVTSGRTVDLANVENVVGPCYQFTPVRVTFEEQWIAAELLRFVQRQSAESAAHDFVGFEKIAKQCTQWSAKDFFDSVVHHQDADEDFDTMPLAQGKCRVDILKPHGDAAYPFKAVSFIRGGEVHVGVVGSGRDSAFVDAMLDELVAAVDELATPSSKRLLFDGGMFSTV
ncbi:uncharacterized protein K452DRAFT_303125 [Neofusicoccum parvum]|uniref:Uncharacterized protein K452DRAFT_303125 n=1 Tax=Neofusicoccum parvum TaxID=310453 RepID=A0ACB5SKZ2_9PEZI|nr:uncharacterized protein K452DRAFT_303125 [Neofusicoccum parvum]